MARETMRETAREMVRVAIVGRPNVGKSTLFNRLAGRRAALVGDNPGVTRDWREGPARLGPARFRLIDTAGLEDALDDSLEARALAHTGAALDTVDLTPFALDGRAGLTPVDRHFARWLRRRGGPVVVLVNKAEGAAEQTAIDALELGLGDPVAVSGQHGLGMAELYDAMVAACPRLGVDEDAEPEPADALKLAIVGRPNVGKSTLMNRMLGEARVLAGPEAGITRDAVAAHWSWRGRGVEPIDTAGLRRKSRVPAGGIERRAADAARRAIAACHVAALTIDATGPMDRQDFAIARQILDEGRAIVIAANKWDLVPSAARRAVRAQLARQLRSALAQARGVAVAPVSALTGSGLDRLMEEAFASRDIWSRRLPTAELNRWLAAMLAHRPPPLDGGRRVRVRYIAQVSARPPTFALFVNRPGGLAESWRRYLINGLRESFDLPGTPIRLLPRAGRNPYAPAKRPRRA